MDRWIRQLDAVRIIDLPGGCPVVEYTNSLGDKIKINKCEIKIYMDRQTKVFRLNSIDSVDMNPMFKENTEKPYLYIKTKDETIQVLIDTHTGDFHDLPTVYDYIRRIVTVYR